MFIQTEVTPNPNALKFLPGITILSGAPRSFKDDVDSVSSPLAKLLLSIDDVREVFFANDFITVLKEEKGNWDLMKPEVLITIMDYIVAGREIIVKTENTLSQTIAQEEDEVTKEIIEIIENRVRPAVAADGGDIIFHSYIDGIVKLELKGSCLGCPSSTITLKNGIENMLKHYIPEIIAVEEVEVF